MDKNFNYVGEQKLNNFIFKNIIATPGGFIQIDNKNHIKTYKIIKNE